MDSAAESKIDIQNALDLTHEYIGPTCGDVDYQARCGFDKMHEMIEAEILQHEETLTPGKAKQLVKDISDQLLLLLDSTVDDIKQVGTISMRDALSDMAYDLMVKIENLKHENRLMNELLEKHKIWGLKSQTTQMFERLKDECVR